MIAGSTRASRTRYLAYLLVLAVLVVSQPSWASPTFPGILSETQYRAAEAEATQQKIDAQMMVQRNALALGFNDAQIERALTPSMIRKGTFIITLSDGINGTREQGTQIEFPWYRIGFAENELANTSKEVDRSLKETNKGGVRLHYGVFEDEVYALAVKMDTKLALTRDAINGHSFRGAKGGIGAGRVLRVSSVANYALSIGDIIDPASSAINRADMMKQYATAYRRAGGKVGVGLDIQAGDMNTKAAEMKVLAEEGYGTARNPSIGVSGKAVRTKRNGTIDPRGGIEFRATSTGVGVWMATRLAAKHAGVKLYGSSVVAQGWGEVGRAFGYAALKDGARIVGIQEQWNVNGQTIRGLLLQPKGVSAKPRDVKSWLASVERIRNSGADVMTFENGIFASSFIPNGDASTIKADIVGINATGNMLTETSVPVYANSGTHQGKPKILSEGANLAQTAEGALTLRRYPRSLLAIPGDLANLGGVLVSDMEAAQNFYREAVPSKKAQRSLQGTMIAGWRRAVTMAKAQRLTISEAVERVAVDGMMRRSLHLPNAPRANIETRVISREGLRQRHR